MFRFYENHNNATRPSSMVMPLSLASNSKANITMYDCCSIETHHRTQHNNSMHHRPHHNVFLFYNIDAVTPNWSLPRTCSASTRTLMMRRRHGNASRCLWSAMMMPSRLALNSTTISRILKTWIQSRHIIERNATQPLNASWNESQRLSLLCH